MLVYKGSTYVMQGTGGISLTLKRTYNCNMMSDQVVLCVEFGANPD